MAWLRGTSRERCKGGQDDSRDHGIQAVSADGKLSWTATIIADSSAQRMVKMRSPTRYQPGLTRRLV